MRILLSLSSLLLATTSLAAQSGSTAANLLLQAPPGSRNCPVSLTANHLPNTGVAEISKGPHPKGQPLYLAFRPGSNQGITAADLVLHGMAGSRLLHAGATSGADVTESFTVTPSAALDHLYNSVVYARKLTGVSYVELRSLTFADGTVWHASAASTCRVAPNGFQLFASGR